MTDHGADIVALNPSAPVGGGRDMIDAFAMFKAEPLSAHNENAYRSATEMLIGIFEGLGWKTTPEVTATIEQEQFNGRVLSSRGNITLTPERVAANLKSERAAAKASADKWAWSVSAALIGPRGGMAYIAAHQRGGISDASAMAYGDPAVWAQLAADFAGDDLFPAWATVTENRTANAAHSFTATRGSHGGRDGYHETLRLTRRAPEDLKNAARLGIPVTPLSVSRHWHCRLL